MANALYPDNAIDATRKAIVKLNVAISRKREVTCIIYTHPLHQCHASLAEHPTAYTPSQAAKPTRVELIFCFRTIFPAFS